jgi:vacuolar iron transporter family protein
VFSVIGLSDGLTVPFALTAGLSALGESKYVVLAGVAELIAGCISMGIGGFLASQSERDHYRYLRQQTASRVDQSCAGEMDREVAEILSPLGVSDKACNVVAQSLREAEEDYDERFVPSANGDAEAASLRWRRDVGLTAFLLKFGKGMGTFTLSYFLPSFHLCNGAQRKFQINASTFRLSQ